MTHSVGHVWGDCGSFKGQSIMTVKMQNNGKHVPAQAPNSKQHATGAGKPQTVREIGGPKGPEPTRYGDWERRGRCIDF
jgi:hypothetical protein